MEKSLNDLSGSALRKLAVSEIKHFIRLLDMGTTEELQQKRTYLSEIYARLCEKEQEELQHLMTLVSQIASPSPFWDNSRIPLSSGIRGESDPSISHA